MNLSPNLFKCFNKNKSINMIKVKLFWLNIAIGISLGIVTLVWFTDDIVMITESKDDVRRAVDKIIEIK